jgi:hypothetical protein
MRQDNRPADTSGFGLVFQHLTTTVETVGADVVAQVGFAGGRFNSDARHGQAIVRAVHAALGGGLFVLLDGHDGLLKSVLVRDAPIRGWTRAKPRIPPAIRPVHSSGRQRKAKDYSPNPKEPQNGVYTLIF